MMPNFLVVGANKAGTSSLYHHLRQHPDVFMSPIKEPRFFAFDGIDLPPQRPGDELWRNTLISSEAEYEQLFSDAREEIALGECSTLYLASPHAASRIQHHVPSARIIAILRDPSERAYSQFLMGRRLGYEPLSSFAEALDAEPERNERYGLNELSYSAKSFYAGAVSRYLRLMGPEQVRFYTFERYKHRPQDVLYDICKHLGIRETHSFDLSLRKNTNDQTRSPSVDRILRGASALGRTLPTQIRKPAAKLARRVRQANRQRPAPLSRDLRQRLVATFMDDVIELEELLGLDLSAWRSA